VLWEISYANLNMLLATIPSYESPEEKKDVEEVDGIADLAKYLDI
jgi:hypothetical protein